MKPYEKYESNFSSWPTFPETFVNIWNSRHISDINENKRNCELSTMNKFDCERVYFCIWKYNSYRRYSNLNVHFGRN